MVSSIDSPAVSRPSSGVVSPSHTRMPSRSRAQSISSDRPSTVAHSLMSPPLSVSPDAAFIASSAASQIVSNDHDSHADAWFDEHGIEPSGEPAMVSPAALQLVNNFLDQLLFNFLSVARSTSLSSLRPAVTEVLKPKLAKDAINQADEELREYLGGVDEDSQPNLSVSPRDWDLELVWKRTRLRCMVYSSLGDMEDEDEDYHMEKEHLEPDVEDRLSEVVSPAVAIFLTSILEFMGEQALVVAGQAAFHRMRTKHEKDVKGGARNQTEIDRIVVEELDVERVALDRTLGRLWRAWKKKIRTPVAPSFPGMDNSLNKSYSRESMRNAVPHLRSPSTTVEAAVPPTVPEPAADAEMEAGANDQDGKEVAIEEEEVEEYLVAAAIPLPLGPNDVEEIEVPGLASYDDEIEVAAHQQTLPSRPKSMLFLGTRIPYNPAMWLPQTPVLSTRKRSNSLPNPAAAPFDSPTKRQRIDEPDTDVAVNDEAKGEDTTANAQPYAASPQLEAGPAAAEKSKSTTGGLTADDTEDQEEEDEVDFVIEEPLILTSSRVSISGRSSSPSTSDHGRPADIITNIPARPQSVHSARLIDVAGPRSPATISRGSPVDPADIVRGNLSRSSSLRATQIMDDRARRSPDITSAPRQSSSNLSRSMLVASDERDEHDVSPITPVSASLPSIPEPTSTSNEDEESEMQTQAPIFGSANRQGVSRPSSPPKPTTKVTIISSNASSGTFLDTSDEPSPPRKRSAEGQTRGSPSRSSSTPLPGAPPTVPERSPSRQALSNTSQPTTIGQVSVERTRTRSPSDSYTSRPQEQSSPAGKRPQHTSGSSSTTSSYKIKPVRTSEDGSFTRGDMARNFEELIQSDQTIQYTLTPESMRDIDSASTRSIATGSPVIPVKVRRSEEARGNGDRSRSSSFAKPNELTRSGSISRTSGTLSESRASNRANPPQARDARLPRESLADFAEFIRSTGPNGSIAPQVSHSPTASTVVRNSSGPVPVSKASIDSGRPSTTLSNPNRPRLQARDASTDRRDDNSDLIDFIRRGPPSVGGTHRIPRSVAPFRSTMDSDQMSGAVGGRAVDAIVDVRSSQASTNVTDYSSSINSSSALLPPANRNKPLPKSHTSVGNYGAADTNTNFDDEMPIPKRKTRRVRDPYAIDLSDEDEMDEEEYLAAMTPGLRPKPQQTQEESLMDFLKNVPPPPPEPTPEVRQFVETKAQAPKKKSSTQGLMARFSRSRGDKERTASKGSLSSITGGKGLPFSASEQQASQRKPAAALRTTSTTGGSVSGAGARGYIPIQVNMPPGVGDQYGIGVTTSIGTGGARPPVSMNTGMGVSANGVPSSGGRRVPMKKFEPREAVSVPSRATSDLAEFFKNSAPPGGGFAGAGPAGPAGSGAAPGEDSRSGTWNRRRKASVA
ncbi:hypothetical protein V8F20_005701 [Naviculisporaceae sp. PSN 640]